MQARNEASVSNQWETQLEKNGELSYGTIQAKLVRLEFPRYDDLDDPTIWLCQAKQFFEF